MSGQKKAPVDTETILMTLDQLGQTIDIMTTVVGRLRHYVSEQHKEKQYNSDTLPTTPPQKAKSLKIIEDSLRPISTTLH
ncbi:MAG: hypothetical protein ACJA0N_001003 [Pseudohongiellaceae bacterium]|jgi:hypothetical protein